MNSKVMAAVFLAGAIVGGCATSLVNTAEDEQLSVYITAVKQSREPMLGGP